MLGQAVRRFTTSAVRASHYGEGPGQVFNLLQFHQLFQKEKGAGNHGGLALVLTGGGHFPSYGS